MSSHEVTAITTGGQGKNPWLLQPFVAIDASRTPLLESHYSFYANAIQMNHCFPRNRLDQNHSCIPWCVNSHDELCKLLLWSKTFVIQVV